MRARDIIRASTVLVLLLPVARAAPATQPAARWIWSPDEPPAPRNRLTWFRRIVELKTLPSDGRLRLAADSNAALWVNGHSLLHKVPRYHEKQITAVEVNAGPYLRPGNNEILVRHHNWGDIITFQRTGNAHAGLWIESDWVITDATWECRRAEEYFPHEKQIVGLTKDPRIRYAQIVDGRKEHSSAAWKQAVVVDDGPWPQSPALAETPPQREYPVLPIRVLAAGRLSGRTDPVDDPFSIAAGIRAARCEPSEEAARAAGELLSGRAVTIDGRAGEWHYVTFDFGLPVHGYPQLLVDGMDGAAIDLGYCELTRSQYSGEYHVRPDGWINPEGVVGVGYADRYITREGLNRVEMPDERTARWLTLHVYFPSAGRVVLREVGFLKSQHPVDLKGSFACGDERMDQIVKLCLIHAEVTMSDSYIDTPGREDGQWLEDARPRAILASRWFGDTTLRELMIRTIAQSQNPDGQLHPFPPSNYPAYPANYDWSVQWVAMLYDQYMWTGQTEPVRQYLNALDRHWKTILSHVDDEGLWRTNRVFADIRVGLHPENDTQSSGIVTPWIIERLRWSAEMADAIGERKLAAGWRATADNMASAFRTYHIVPPSGEIAAHVGDRVDPSNPRLSRGFSQAGQTIAVTAGLLTPEEAAAAAAYAFPQPDGSPPKGVTRWNNPTYSYRSLRAMSHVGRTDVAVRHLIERYEQYLPGHPRNPIPPILQGPYGGPLPEYWISREDHGLAPGAKNSAQPVDDTGSHGWGSVPLLWLHDTLLGVTITRPGGGEIRIAPDAGALPFVAGHTVTPKGVVWVSWDPGQGRLEVQIPARVAAEVVMPRACARKRTQVLESAGKVEIIGENHFRIGDPGRFAFAVRG